MEGSKEPWLFLTLGSHRKKFIPSSTLPILQTVHSILQLFDSLMCV
jgi:hypothetical protein